MSIPLPDDEEGRLADLHRLNILDTLSEELYDSITQMASNIFETPIALISFVDKDRQWFKSKIGLELTETSRDIAFCAINILDDEPLIVEDATTDERFKNNPLVTEDPNIRFYAGSPIKSSNNYRLGSLCVIDTKPREISERDKIILSSLSQQVSHLLEIRSISEELKMSLKENQQLRSLLPICSRCNRIRDTSNHWSEVEDYLVSTTEKEISHSICPECSAELEPDLDLV